MRLNLTLPELEAGKAWQTGASDRILDICMAADRREPFPIVPLEDHDHRLISIIIFTQDAERHASRCQLYFRPIWNKTFTLYSHNPGKDRLLALIIELSTGKYWVDNSGYKSCNLTTNGNGTDPKTVRFSHFILAEMLALPERPYILQQAIELLKKAS